MQNLAQAIEVRYNEEAESCCGLSCGNALTMAEPVSGEVFLDLGSGRGMDVIRAARMVEPDGFAYGVDYTEKMLKVSENNRMKLKIQNAEFLNSSIETIPLDDNKVDVVISNCTINHAQDKAAVYKEIHRVLKPGGRFIVSDVLAEHELPEEVRNDPAAWAACYGGAIPEKEYYEAVSSGGFDAIEILEKSQPYEKGGVMVLSVTLRGYKK